ncbi:hypothetical protein SAY87_003573 [Trapa incisa]|uniref:Uncharacterized protein n=1 Tax=Trapa incisa TaxID=236973 RepID=A0AAN7KL56_9MYRT|nr:hypothetical protein SAY87_003573 [Trapa incisa]
MMQHQYPHHNNHHQRRSESFIIPSSSLQDQEEEEEEEEVEEQEQERRRRGPTRGSIVHHLRLPRRQLPIPPNITGMKIFSRFRKIIMRFVFSLPSRESPQKRSSPSSSSEHKPDPPKTSCSSYYSSHSHYNEAIADCIEFFNKSSQEGWFLQDGRNSDVNIV